MKLKSILVLTLFAVFASGCTTVAKLAGGGDKGVVIAKRAQIRSSGAVVAADLHEVRRGDALEILGEEQFENEKWYNVRASDANNTEGWIEARYLLPDKLLKQSQKLADESQSVPTQAVGQLRASANLRLTPDINNDDNILQKLNSGDTFSIIAWQRVAKPADAAADAAADAPKNGAGAQTGKPKRQKQEDDLGRLDDKFNTWYKVRLDAAVSPAPVGWIYGKQVELVVPPDIIFYRTGREFVAWSRVDGDAEGNTAAFSQSAKDAAKETKPGSWVVLERSNKIIEPEGGEEPDFDRVLVIGYDKYNQDHYQVYRSINLKGFLPLRVTGGGDSRVFAVTVKGSDGQKRDITFSTYKDSRGLLKVKVPDDLPKEDKSSKQ